MTTAARNEHVIEAEHLRCVYGEFTAVDDVSFAVRRGELYALLGTNGAGKTTTLETLEGHRRPASGTVRVMDADPGDRQAARPRMGIMLQESGFAADLTVAETLRLMGRLSGRSDDAGILLERVGLASKHDVRVGQLSGGEKRRLDFATAVYGRPELVFLDEPTTALDPAAREALWDHVTDLRADGVTVVLTTHYLEEAEQHADRIGMMHRGTLHHEGTLPELVAAFPSTIEFDIPRTSAPLPLEVTDVRGEQVSVRTEHLQRDLYRLLGWAAEHRVHLDHLQARSSSLADVFCELAADTAPTQEES
ncbi:ABC transporter ATP-binding protein [Brachybacterium hainanense]|uniref:ABC transporter ATP-binding protein n=1 Tax=Brachybacterium hainanense TaxID=1541174 RepID=A0ABV6RA19_9MICO